MNIGDYEKAKMSLITFYTKIKVRKDDTVRDVSKNEIIKEEENLKDLPLTTLIEYVKSAIDIFVSMKLEEELQKYKTPLMDDDQNEAQYYETLLRKEESAIRQHISVEHFLRGDLDKAKDHLENLTNEVAHLKVKLKKAKMININNDNYLKAIQPEELSLMKEKLIKYEEQHKELIIKESLLKKQLQEKNQEIKLLETKMNNRNNSSYIIGIDKDIHNHSTISKEKDKEKDKDNNKEKLSNVSSSSSLTTLKKPKKLKIKEDPQMKKLQMLQQIQLKSSVNNTLNHNTMSILNSNCNNNNNNNNTNNNTNTNLTNVNYNFIKSIHHCNSNNNNCISINSLNSITSMHNSPQVNYDNYPINEKCDYNNHKRIDSKVNEDIKNKPKFGRKGCASLSYIKVGAMDQDPSLILKRNEELTQILNNASLNAALHNNHKQIYNQNNNNDKKSPPMIKKIGISNSLKDINSRNKVVGKLGRKNQDSIIIHQQSDPQIPAINNINIFATSNDIRLDSIYPRPYQVNVRQNMLSKVDPRLLGKKPRQNKKI